MEKVNFEANDRGTRRRKLAYMDTLDYRVDVDGMTVMAVPPGIRDLQGRMEHPSICISTQATTHGDAIRLNGEKHKLATFQSCGFAIYGAGSDFVLRCTKPGWGLLIEFDAACLSEIPMDRRIPKNIDEIDVVSRKDTKTAMLAQLMISNLREPIVDRLYIGGLASAIAARSMTLGFAQQSDHDIGPADDRLTRAIEYIHAHWNEGFSVAELAALACMSSSWFSRAFKASTGQSVHTYVLDLRLERARLALEETDDLIGIIAHRCGFADHSHMTRLFRRKYGMTPNQMRD